MTDGSNDERDFVTIRKSVLSSMGLFLKDSLHPENSFPSRVWTEFGYGMEEMSAKEWLDKIHPDDRERALRLAQDLNARPSHPRHDEYRVRDSAGNYHWILSTGVVMEVDRDDETAAYLGLDIDVTETHELQHQLREAQALAEQRAVEAEALRNAGAAIAASLDKLEAIRRVVDELTALMPVSLALVYEGVDRELHLAVDPPYLGEGLSEADVTAARELFEAGEGTAVLIEVMRRRSPDLFREPARAGRFWLAVPLVARGVVLGVFVIRQRDGESFAGPETRMVMAMADYLALAFTNARLYNQIREIAQTDGLSGLLTRREFFARGADIVDAAKADGANLSCILLDIDHFKRINDRYGHQVGDAAIRRVAEVFADTIRDGDTVGRYGGEEFCALLPGVSETDAAAIAARVLTNVRETDISEIGWPVTVSIGVAGRRENDTLDAMLAAADAALYRAKHAGRNRVRLRTE